MKKVKIIQQQLDAFCNKVLESNVVDTFTSEDAAQNYLIQRGFKFDSVIEKWVNGNCVHFPMLIETTTYGLGDIRSFI